ncbi:MAG: glycosyltransferase [Spirochaetota bacterium]|nr:glycosyltransferase [Spirochaetota bacterium]
MLHVFLWSAAAYWAAGFCLLWRIPKLGRLDAGEDTPAEGTGAGSGADRVEADRMDVDLSRLSIIIPARNEAGTLPFLLDSLLLDSLLLDSLKKQERLPLEIIVVDDLALLRPFYSPFCFSSSWVFSSTRSYG